MALIAALKREGSSEFLSVRVAQSARGGRRLALTGGSRLAAAVRKKRKEGRAGLFTGSSWARLKGWGLLGSVQVEARLGLSYFLNKTFV